MSKKATEKKPKYKHLHPVTLEACRRKFQELIQTTVGDTPQDTGSTTGQNDLINKTDEGFEHYSNGKFQEGYPK